MNNDFGQTDSPETSRIVIGRSYWYRNASTLMRSSNKLGRLFRGCSQRTMAGKSEILGAQHGRIRAKPQAFRAAGNTTFDGQPFAALSGRASSAQWS